MSKNKIVKLLWNANVDPRNISNIENDSVTVCVGYFEVCNNGTRHGDCDREATDKLANRVLDILGWKSMFRNGYGAWIVCEGATNLDSDNNQ